MRRTVCAATVTAIVGAIALLPMTAADGGPSTFTRITSPSGFVRFTPAKGAFTVSGVASSDVTQVDVRCFDTDDTMRSAVLATVSVAGGRFSAAVAPGIDVNGCVLRAVPASVTSGPYTSFTGPTLLGYGATLTGTPADQEELDLAGRGGGSRIYGPDSGGINFASPVDAITRTASPSAFVSAGQIADSNIDDTAAAIVVDGHFAYTPEEVVDLLDGDTGLSFTTPGIKAHVSSNAKTGDLSAVTTFPLVRCSTGDQTVPSSTSCPSIVKVPVTLTTTTVARGGGLQDSVRYAFTSTDARSHLVTVELRTTAPSAASGQPGFRLPGHAKFVVEPTSPVVARVPDTAQSTLIHGDVYAADGDPHSSYAAITTSGPPQRLEVAIGQLLVMTVERHVPAHGSAAFTLETSESLTEAGVQALAAKAEDAMTGTLQITEPAARQLAAGKVSVSVEATGGGNGLPAALRVNGRRATLHHQSGNTAIFTTVVRLSRGKQAITATATDPGGVKEKTSRTVKAK